MADEQVSKKSGKIKLTLSPQAQKYARRDAPVEGRRMAARGALPLEAIELATVLFALTHDPDAQVKETARSSLEQLPDPVLDTVLSGAAHPSVLAFFAQIHKSDEEKITKLALNPATDDRTVAFLATLPCPAVVDIVSQNQERLMRCEEIVDSLGNNPLTGRAVIERILTFLGMSTPASTGEVGEKPLTEEDAEAAVLALLGDELAGFAPEILAEKKPKNISTEREELSGNLFAALSSMTVLQKVKLARLGGTEARGLLIRDRNKVVASAAISSPKITDSEVEGYAKSRALCDDVMRIIATNRQWTKNYAVKLALAMNPKVPKPLAIGFLAYLQDKDLKTIMKSRDVSSNIAAQARRLLQKKGKI